MEYIKLKQEYKYLKLLDSIILEKLLKSSNLSEDEYWVLKYSIIQDRMVENTCAKLSISKSTYRNLKNTGLAKLDITFKNLLKD